MKFLSSKEKRIALICVFVVCLLLSIITLISSVISCFQLWLDLPFLDSANYMEDYYYLLIVQLMYTLSVILSFVTILSTLSKIQTNIKSQILAIVCTCVFVLFTIALRILMPSSSSGYIFDEPYNLFSLYVSKFFLLGSCILIANIAKIKLEKVNQLGE